MHTYTHTYMQNIHRQRHTFSFTHTVYMQHFFHKHAFNTDIELGCNTKISHILHFTLEKHNRLTCFHYICTRPVQTQTHAILWFIVEKWHHLEGHYGAHIYRLDSMMEIKTYAYYINALSLSSVMEISILDRQIVKQAQTSSNKMYFSLY